MARLFRHPNPPSFVLFSLPHLLRFTRSNSTYLFTLQHALTSHTRRRRGDRRIRMMCFASSSPTKSPCPDTENRKLRQMQVFVRHDLPTAGEGGGGWWREVYFRKKMEGKNCKILLSFLFCFHLYSIRPLSSSSFQEDRRTQKYKIYFLTVTGTGGR